MQRICSLSLNRLLRCVSVDMCVFFLLFSSTNVMLPPSAIPPPQGMAYLELNRMVHSDLAARNVLVESVSKVKITHFGLSKCLDVGESGYKAGQGKVSVRWLAPECLRSRKFSHKSDVWAFGGFASDS